MEDILIIDNNSIEENVFDETEFKDNQPVDCDLSTNKNISKNELIEEENIDGFKQINQPDGIVRSGNVINNNRSSQNIDIDNYDSFDLWVNSSPNSGIGQFEINLDLSDYDLIGIEYKTHKDLNYISTFILKKDDFVLLSEKNIVGLVGYENGYPVYVRLCYYNSNNTIVIYRANQWQTGSYNNDWCIPLRILGYKVKTLSSNENPVNPIPSVSGNNIYYNYNIYCDGISDNSLSYNVLNKPLNEYSVSESLLGMSVLFMLAFGFVLLMRKAVFRWR